MVEKSVNSKEYERFKQQLASVNPLFERAREWADLSNCLQKVKKTIDQNPGLPVPNKKDLAKRLAQCLNPDLNVIHQLTLEVYAWIFAREISLLPADEDQATWGSDLGLFYSGLFNFYQYAAFEVKRQFLKIIQEYVLKLKKELLLSLPGFMLCMLPALEDQNSDLLKQVEAILAETEKIVGTTKFFGEIWKAMLRTPRCRLSATKYLDRKIPRTTQLALKLIKEGKIYISPYHYEIKLGRVILTDQKLWPEWFQNEKRMLDLLQKEESMEAYFFFYYPNKEQMVNNALLAGLSIVSQDVYVNRAAFDFLISHMPITSPINNREESINIVEGALLTLVKKDFASLKKFFNWFQGHFDDQHDQHSIKNDPAIQFVNPALQRIFKKFYKVKTEQKVIINEMGIQERSLWTINTPIQILINLLSDNMPLAEPILSTISVDLINYIRHFYKADQGVDPGSLDKFKQYVINLFQMVQSELRCVWQALGSLLQEEIMKISDDVYKIEAIDLITFFLIELQPAINQQQKDEPVSKQSLIQAEQLARTLIPIVSGLLSGIEKLSNSNQNVQYALPALDLVELILKMIDQQKTNLPQNISILKASVQKFNQFYINMCNLLAQDSTSSSDKVLFTIFKKSSYILYRVQVYTDLESAELMPDWLKTVIECSCERKRGSRLILISIEAFLCIIEYLGDNKTLLTLQNLILPNFRKNQQHNYCMDIIKTLWSLLDEPEDHEKIVLLLKKFDKLLPKIFSDVVTQELNSKDREIKHRAVKKFSIFWKRTTPYYPEYKPFQPVCERIREKNNETSIALTHHISEEYEGGQNERSYVALHNMLHILEDQDPTMRLSCRSWLSDSKSAYLRILDPLLTEFIDNNKVFVSFTGQLFFMEGYETNIIIENFGKLRNIILNTQDELIKYIVTTKLSSFIQMIFQNDYKFLKGNKSKVELVHSEGKYIQAIVFITLQFIMGQAVESLNQQLYQESQTVNASAAEFMELILKSVQPYKDLANEIAHVIINPVVKTLKQSIDNGNVAQQVHLLNLLKVVFFECNFYSPQLAKKTDSQSQAAVQNAKDLLSDQKFLQCICDGMKNELSFVRNAFIQFAVKIVPFMRDIVDARVMATQAVILSGTFCQLLIQTDVSQFQQNQRDFLKEQKQDTALRKGKFIINQENDIIMIINGLKSVLGTCLGLTDDSINMEENIEDQLKDLGKATQVETNSYSIFNMFKSKEIIGPRDPNQEVKEAIFKEMQNIIVSCINIWNDLDLYRVRNYFFSRMGVFPYHKDDDKRMDQQINEKLVRQSDNNQEQNFNQLAQNPKKSIPAESMIDTSSKKRTVTQQQNNTVLDQGAYIKSNLNPIQLSIISLLEPVNQKYSYYLIRGFIEIWKASSNLTQAGINVNQGCEKIIQLLISLQVEPHEVIDAVNRWITLNNYVTVKEKKVVELNDAQKEKATLQSLICQLVYTYLLYSIQNHFKMLSPAIFNAEPDNRALLVQEQYIKLYANCLKFIKSFLHSKHSNTINWLQEILYILMNRFKPDDAKLEKRLKLEFSETFEQLLKSSAMVLTDSFGVVYTSQYGINQICYSPTCYEMVKRFEFVKQKAPEEIRSLYQQQNDGQITIGRKTTQSNTSLSSINSVLSNTSVKQEHQNLYLSFNQHQLQAYEEIPFQKDSIFLDMEQMRSYEKQNVNDEISIFFRLMNQFLHNDSIKPTPAFQNEIFKVMAIITSRQLLVKMTMSVYSSEETEKTNMSLSIIVASVMKILDIYVKQISSMKDPEQLKRSQIQGEFFTEFLAGLATENQILQKMYKKEITEMFNSDNFFLLSERTLRKWQQIMRNFMSVNNEVFDELLQKFNKVEGLFVSKKWEIQQKSLTFKRLAFLVYSSQMNSFEEAQLDTLLKKMTEGFKNTSKDREMTMQLFLLSRILMLRLSTQALADALRKLWPHLLNELVNVFDVPNTENRDYLLQIEGIKIVELMSQLNIEDFHMNQWMFLFDGYGMDIQPNQQVIESHINDQQDKEFVDIGSQKQSDVFQPYLIKFMCNKSEFRSSDDYGGVDPFAAQEFSFYKVLTQQEIGQAPKKTQPSGPNPAEFRKTAFTMGSQVNPDDKSSLEEVAFRYAHSLQQLLTDANVERTEIDRESAEALIEKDFLTKPRYNE